MIDHTHDAARKSWVASADGHAQFPLQNLPMGVLDQDGGRIGVAIGDRVLDVRGALDAGLLPGLSAAAGHALRGCNLNAWMALPQAERRAIRHALFALLADDSPAASRADPLLHAMADCRMALPAAIGGYTDFYCGIHHAVKAGTLFRPDCPLLPNYKHLPIAYHGRTSSITVSGQPVRRPWGQVDTGGTPRLQPSARVDFELELALWAGPGNALGDAVPISAAHEHIAGYGLFNDWSARDIQAWEYKPLGPFQGKNFASTVSPWIVTAEALAPFRGAAMARAPADPPLADYLADARDQREGGLDIHLEVWLTTQDMRERGMPEVCLARSHTRHLYWTPAQMLAQHTLGGCNLRPGDLLASGTISTPDHSGDGSLLERTAGGREPVTLPSGEQRTFLCDGDEITLRAHCRTAPGYALGFGDCRARVLPAHPAPYERGE
ncbi:fumarylacetoacetase [Bordetella petrii]|nr:fumarylacetoacetase [Bordetella petrii]